MKGEIHITMLFTFNDKFQVVLHASIGKRENETKTDTSITQ